MRVTLLICAAMLLLAVQVTSGNSSRQKSGSNKPIRKSAFQKDKCGKGKRKHVNWPEEIPVEIEDSASDSMPDNFELNLSFGKQKMKLPLGKNKRINMDLPIIYSTKKGNRVLFNGKKRLSVYRDPKTEASIIVDLEGGKKRYSGQFYVNGEEFKLKPVKKTHSHVISKSKPGSDAPGGVDEFESVLKPETEKLTKKRVKRQRPAGLAQDTYDVELLFVIDYSIYRKWFELSDEATDALKRDDAIRNIHFFFTHVANGVSQRYETVMEGTFRLNTALSGIHIMTANDAPWRRDNLAGDILDGPTAIVTLDGWLDATVLPAHDHAALIISDQLRGWSRRLIYGMSPVQGICTDTTSDSISREIGLYNTIQTFAHELGHNLGANHDSSGNACSSGDQYVMATSPIELDAANFNNAFQFSSCSEDYFVAHMRRLEAAGDNCLADNGDEVANQIQYLRTLAGQEYSPDEQCEIIYGTGAYYCRGISPPAEICSKMECFNPAQGRCVNTVEQRAAKGTICGNNMWCQSGVCTADANAPPARAVCIYGDYTGTFPGGLTCEQANISGRCAEDPYRLNCCLACAGDACIDRVDWCPRYVHTCYINRDRDVTCCRTCRDRYRPDKPGCEYGDRATLCTLDDCRLDRVRCCGTCGL